MPSKVLAPAHLGRSRSDEARSALRAEVSRWFSARSRARVTHFGRIYPGGSRYICMRAPKPDGFFALYFFHHGKDDWRIYPPWGIGPSIVYWSASVKQPVTLAAAGPKRRLRASLKS